MSTNRLAIGIFVLCATLAAAPNSPVYRVTVIDRRVESKAGRTEIDARLSQLLPPTRFGREYLTYVLWAVTPEGHAKNLGELLAGSLDKARLRVTTDLQAFGMSVTAEPYSAVRLPSDVVVLENVIRRGTNGRREPIQAKYELLPRGHYTYSVPVDVRAVEGAGPKLSMDQYQQVVELYEAQNAVQIAASAGAGKCASDTLGKAQAHLREAQAAQARNAGLTTVVTAARQAAETAEDARMLAVQRRRQAELSEARAAKMRAQLLSQLHAVLPARDTPRGLLVTLPDADFRGASVSPFTNERLSRIAAMLQGTPRPGGRKRERADAVRELLVRDGAPPRAVWARDLGDSRPLVSHHSPSGREQNRRVEIVIAGQPIGDLPYWAKTYSLTPRR